MRFDEAESEYLRHLGRRMQLLSWLGRCVSTLTQAHPHALTGSRPTGFTAEAVTAVNQPTGRHVVGRAGPVARETWLSQP